MTVAGVGAEVTRAQQPRLPLLADEVGEEYRRAYDAGATIGHIHGRRPDGTPTQDRETFRAYSEAIRARCPIVRQFSTGGAVGMGVEERIEALDLGPEMATLTLGTCNFGNDVFENSLPTIRTILERIRKHGIVPELEIFDLGMTDYARFLVERGVLRPPFVFNVLLGSLGTLAATPLNLAVVTGALPEGSVWAGAGIGRFQLPMNALAIAAGGHVRVGLEDNLWLDHEKTRPATNLALVERLVSIARAAERPIATPTEARELIGLLRPA